MPRQNGAEDRRIVEGPHCGRVGTIQNSSKQKMWSFDEREFCVVCEHFLNKAKNEKFRGTQL